MSGESPGDPTAPSARDGASFQRHVTDKVLTDPGYSVRRYLVDVFFHKAVMEIPENCLVLDIGGEKKSKRGFFDISTRPLKVVYANICDSSSPDIVCASDAAAVKSGRFDAVICGETLEHAADPQASLGEIARALRPGGVALITVPFMFHIHADPRDYGRYTATYWKSAAARAGFSDARVESQGGYYITAANMYKTWMWGFRPESFKGKVAYKLARTFMPHAIKWLMRLEGGVGDNPVLNGHTIGYCMKLVK